MTQNDTITSVFQSQVPRRTKYFLLISNNFYLILSIPVLALILFLNITPLISIGLGVVVVLFLAIFWKTYNLDIAVQAEDHPHHNKSWNSFHETISRFTPLLRKMSAWQISLIGWVLANIPICLFVLPELLNHPISITPRLGFDLYWLAYIPVLVWISYRTRDHSTEWFLGFWLLSTIGYSACFFLVYGNFTSDLILHLTILLSWFLFISLSIHYLFRRIANLRGQSEVVQTVTERLRNNRKYTDAFDFRPIQNGADVSLMEIAEHIGQTLLYDRVFILVRGEDNTLYMKGRFGIDAPWPKKGWQVEKEPSITGWVAQNKKAHLCPDTSKCDLFYNPNYAYPCKSEAAVPIISEGECIGVIDVESDHPNAFHQSDIRLLWQIANSIGAAISYERHVSNEVDRTQTILKEASEILAKSKNLDDALGKVAQNIRQVFRVDLVLLYKHAVATCVPLPGLIIEGEALFPEILGHSIRKDSRVNELVLRPESSYISPHADEDVFLLGPNNGDYLGEDVTHYGTNARFVKREKIKSMIYLKLGVGNDVVGSLFLNFRRRMHFPKRMIESLHAVVNVLSMGLILKRQLERAVGPLAGATPLAHSTAEAAFESVSRDFDELDLKLVGMNSQNEKIIKQIFNYKEKLDNLRMEWTNLILVEQMHLKLSSMVEPISHLEIKLHSMFPNVVFKWKPLQFLGIPTSEFGEVVYKVIAEGISNALVHAHAKNIELDSTILNGNLIIRIVNDGKPIDPDLVVKINNLVTRNYLMDGSEKHTGIISILLDARRWFGAEWNFLSGEMHGAKLEVKLPLGIYDYDEDYFDEH